mmetsp:Transcript_105380/g.339893  ORF Transcript_105380/g.339893 Transcript_105380/m.339893 type:complete len:213 (-) Transcript_105380:116-754(-)
MASMTSTTDSARRRAHAERSQGRGGSDDASVIAKAAMLSLAPRFAFRAHRPNAGSSSHGRCCCQSCPRSCRSAARQSCSRADAAASAVPESPASDASSNGSTRGRARSAQPGGASATQRASAAAPSTQSRGLLSWHTSAAVRLSSACGRPGHRACAQRSFSRRAAESNSLFGACCNCLARPSNEPCRARASARLHGSRASGRSQRCGAAADA